MSFLFDSTFKVSLIVLAALGATFLLGRRSAAVRPGCWPSRSPAQLPRRC